MPTDAQNEPTAGPDATLVITPDDGRPDPSPDAGHLIPSPDTSPDELIFPAEAATFLGVSERTIRRWCESGLDGQGRPFKAVKLKEEIPGGQFRWWVVGPLQRMDAEDGSEEGTDLAVSEPSDEKVGQMTRALESLIQRTERMEEQSEARSSEDLHRAYGVVRSVLEARAVELESRLNQAEARLSQSDDRLRQAEADRQRAELALKDAEASRQRAEADVTRLRNQGVFDRLLGRDR